MSDSVAFDSVESVQRAFAAENYIADRPLALTVMTSFSELGVIVTLAFALGRQAAIPGDGTILKRKLLALLL